jgi:glycerol uptake facilitator-like aquaporin
VRFQQRRFGSRRRTASFLARSPASGSFGDQQIFAVTDHPPLIRRIAAEGIGSFFLFACVIGSGIMAANLSQGNDAVALLGNTIATGAMLFVLITMLGPISGAHMNPAVSLVAASRHELKWRDAGAYILVQFAFGILGAWAAHLMFDLPMLQLSVKARSGLGQLTGEFIATFGLILTILGTVRFRRAWVPASVALYITAAYWFTSSTSFANPAITVARSLSDTFAGIAPHDVPLFIAAQLIGAAAAAMVARSLFDRG